VRARKDAVVDAVDALHLSDLKVAAVQRVRRATGRVVVTNQRLGRVGRKRRDLNDQLLVGALTCNGKSSTRKMSSSKILLQVGILTYRSGQTPCGCRHGR
jgi:hypothetical protein